MAFNLNQNRDISNNLINDFGLNQLTDVVPTKVNDNIQPVYPVYDKVTSVLKSVVKSTTAGTSTLVAANANYDFYITYLDLSLVADASCDWAAGNVAISCTINGVSTELLSVQHFSTTALSINKVITFPIPLKIDRNTAVAITAPAFTAGNLRQAYTCGGFYKYNKENTLR